MEEVDVSRGVETLVLTTLLLGCTGAKYAASFKSTSGGAMAPPGVSGGRTNTVRIADSSGVLSRAGLLGLAAFTAAGAYRETSRTSRSYRSGDYIVTETTSSGYVDQATAAAAQDLADAAFANEPVGIQASLEIASRDLGGDTSGWMYHAGYSSEPFECGPHLACRFYGGVGFGRYTFHDRTLTSDAGTERMGEARYSYIGSPLRLEVAPASFVSGYVQADLNWLTAFDVLVGEEGSPSPWHVGVELRFEWLVGRVQQSWGRMAAGASSTTFEVGVGF